MDRIERKVQRLIRLLKHDDPNERVRAAELLGKMRAKTVIALHALMEALRDEHTHAADCALEALQKMSSMKETIPALVQALDHEEYGVYMRAAIGLANIGLAAVLELKRAARQAKNAPHRNRIREVLGEIEKDIGKRKPRLGIRNKQLQHEDDSRRFERTAFPARSIRKDAETRKPERQNLKTLQRVAANG